MNSILLKVQMNESIILKRVNVEIFSNIVDKLDNIFEL